MTAVRGRRRRCWSAPGKAYIEIRTVERDEDQQLARAVEATLTAVAGVEWVAVNAVLGRVVVAFENDQLTSSDLVGVVAEVERAHGVDHELFPAERPDLPGGDEVVGAEVLALAADVGAICLAVSGRVARLGKLPAEVAALVPLVQSQPRLRQLLEGQLGPTVTSLGLALANAAAQAVAQGPLGLVVDAAQRAVLVHEALAHRRAWESGEAGLCRSPGCSAAPPPGVGGRPVALPAGPVESYAERAGLASIVGGAGGLVSTRSLRRGSAALLAAMPKAAIVGREAFAAQLGAALARRGVLCLDPSVLRRLDRLDCLALDAEVVRTGGKVVERVMAVGGAEAATVNRRARALLDGRQAGGARRRRGWALGPLADLGIEPDDMAAVNEARAHLGDVEVLGLSREGSLQALVAVGDELDDRACALVEAARAANHMVALAGGDLRLVDRLGADVLVEGGDDLVASVRMMQEDGCGVSLVSASNIDGLAAADCGIGIAVPGGAPPWGADLLCGSLDDARLVVEASRSAHEVSRQSVSLALAGSSLGGVLAFTSVEQAAGARTMTAVNSLALLAVANGVRAARALDRRPAPSLATASPWHELPAGEVIERLASSRSGLNAEEATSRAAESSAAIGGPRSLVVSVLEEMANPLTPVLAGAAAVSGAVGSAADAGIIGAVTALNALVGGAQRHGVERALQQLADSTSQHVRVRRGAGSAMVPAEDLVPGNVVVLESGETVPADCRLLVAAALEVDESSLTGESLPVAKSAAPSYSATVADRSSMLYEGTSIAAGTGEAIVVATGAGTEAGGALGGEHHAASGVEGRLAELTRISMPAAAVGGLAVMATGLVRGTPFVQTLHGGISLAVAAVPEGLPILATMAQLASARRLSRRGALVRNPRAIEALGRVDVLCMDKTGTLTEGRIVLQRVSDGYADRPLADLSTADVGTLAAGLRACPAARPGELLPHLTDRAVLEGAGRCRVVASEGLAGWERHAELPFEPERGYHAVVGRNGGGFLLSVKGAPEVVLPRCDRWREEPLDEGSRSQLATTVDRLGRRGFRVLAVAERSASGRADLDDRRVQRLQLLGFLALSDPVDRRRPPRSSAFAPPAWTSS